MAITQGQGGGGTLANLPSTITGQSGTNQAPPQLSYQQQVQQIAVSPEIVAAAQKAGVTPSVMADAVLTGQGHNPKYPPSPQTPTSSTGGNSSQGILPITEQYPEVKAAQQLAVTGGLDYKKFFMPREKSKLDIAASYLPLLAVAAMGGLAAAPGAVGATAGSTVGPAMGANAGIGTAVGTGAASAAPAVAGTAGGLAGGTGTVGGIFGAPATTGGGLAGTAGGLGGAGTAATSGLGTAVGAGASLSGTGAPGLVSGATTGPAATGATAATSGGTGLGGLLGSITTPSNALGGASVLGLTGQALIDFIMGNQRENAAEEAARLSDPFASQRPQYQKQLSDLMANPNSFADNPAYKFAFGQGQQALERSNVAKGYLGSGNMAVDLTKYGQDAAYTGLNQQQNFLAGLAGANSGSPAAAGQQYQSGANGGLSQIYQGMGALGTLGTGLMKNLTNGSLV